VIETLDGRSGEAVRAPSRALGSGRTVDAWVTDGSRGQGHTKGHLSVGGGGESPLRVSGGTVEATVYDEEGAVGKADELTHGGLDPSSGSGVMRWQSFEAGTNQVSTKGQE